MTMRTHLHLIGGLSTEFACGRRQGDVQIEGCARQGCPWRPYGGQAHCCKCQQCAGASAKQVCMSAVFRATADRVQCAVQVCNAVCSAVCSNTFVAVITWQVQAGQLDGRTRRWVCSITCHCVTVDCIPSELSMHMQHADTDELCFCFR